MNILTEINYDCSFMQTIIRLPQSRSDLESVNISSFAIDNLVNYSNFADQITETFSKYHHITDYIAECKLNDQIYYVKTFPESDTYEKSEIREFICFGEYNRDKSDLKNLFFRIDQSWNNYQYPKLDNSNTLEFLKKHLPLLSGAISSETIFPAIILEQSELNNISDLSINKGIDENKFNDLFLFSTDYYAKSYFLDRIGNVFEFKSEKLQKSTFDFIAWVDNELANIFKPKFAD